MVSIRDEGKMDGGGKNLDKRTKVTLHYHYMYTLCVLVGILVYMHGYVHTDIYASICTHIII